DVSQRARRTNHMQRSRAHGNLGGSLAHKLSISVNLKRRLCLHVYSLGPRILNFRQQEMAPEVHRRKHAQKPEGIERVDAADVELAIRKICLRRDAHAIAIELRVGEGGEQSELLRFGMIFLVELRQPHGISRKFEQQRQQRQSIATVSTQPARHLIGTTSRGRIQAASSDAAEIMRTLWRSGWNDDSEINWARLNFPRFKITPNAQGVLHRTQVQRAGKIVSAACGDNEHGKLEPDQRWEMTMDRSVSAKDQNGVRVAAATG